MDLNQKGVSPVVGTILLIGITVIMVGSIGYFVMSQDTPESAPVVNLSEEVEGSAIYIYHNGGDTIVNAPSTLSVKLNGNNISSDHIAVTGGDNDLEVGERMEISTDFSKGDELIVVHKPSNSILLKSTIEKSPPNRPPNPPENLKSENYGWIFYSTSDLAVDVSDPDGDDIDWCAFYNDSDDSLIDNVTTTKTSPGHYETTWRHLSSKTDYSWYARAADNYGAVSDKSNVDSFTTGSGCPYLYGWNGDSYGLINAVMSGSVLKSFETTGYQETSILEPRENYYDLNLFQKLPERSWINNLGLEVFEHPDNIDILMNQAGRTFTIENPQPVNVANEEGRDITHLLENCDGEYWTSDLEGRDFENRDALVDHIYLDLPENNNSRIKLIVRGRQTFFAEFSLWSVYHYLLGTPNFDYITSFLENDTSSSLASAFYNAFQRFNSIRLQYWNGSEWINFEKIGLMKAFFEKKAVSIDLGEIPGKRIRLSMTAGLHDIDQILVDNSKGRTIESRNLELVQATKYGEKGSENVLKKVRKIDNKYAIIDQGEYINYRFKQLNPPEKGMERTFVLSTGGYNYLLGPEVPKNRIYNLSLAENLARKPYRFESWILPRYTYPENYPYTKYFNMSFAETPF